MASNDLDVGTTVNLPGFVLIQSLVRDLACHARLCDSFRSGLITEEREIEYAQ